MCGVFCFIALIILIIKSYYKKIFNCLFFYCKIELTHSPDFNLFVVVFIKFRFYFLSSFFSFLPFHFLKSSSHASYLFLLSIYYTCWTMTSMHVQNVKKMWRATFLWILIFDLIMHFRSVYTICKYHTYSYIREGRFWN